MIAAALERAVANLESKDGANADNVSDGSQVQHIGGGEACAGNTISLGNSCLAMLWLQSTCCCSAGWMNVF